MPNFDPSALGCRFEFVETLGGGGSGGVVLRCADQVLGREVAVKVLPPGATPEEFKALRGLQHPGVVEVLDQGRSLAGDHAWFSMDLVEGSRAPRTTSRSRCGLASWSVGSGTSPG